MTEIKTHDRSIDQSETKQNVDYSWGKKETSNRKRKIAGPVGRKTIPAQQIGERKKEELIWENDLKGY